MKQETQISFDIIIGYLVNVAKMSLKAPMNLSSNQDSCLWLIFDIVTVSVLTTL